MPQQRYNMVALRGSERPAHRYEYYVSGSGAFPLDMLRYDACWPATGEDAASMGITMRDDPEAYRKVRSIRILSHSEPTLARWASFTWSVGLDKL